MAPGLTDEAVLALAHDQGAILVTADKDFGRRHQHFPPLARRAVALSGDSALLHRLSTLWLRAAQRTEFKSNVATLDLRY